MSSSVGSTEVPITVHAPRANRRSSWSQFRKDLPWYLFIAPNMLSFLIFALFCWAFLAYLSFHDWNLVGVREFSGLGNFSRMLTDEVLHKSVVNTFIYVLLFVLPVAVVGLSLALLVNQRLRGMHLFRTSYYLPVVTSVTVIVLIWRFILVPRSEGVLNYVLGQVGLPPQEWLLNPKLAMPSIVGMQIWSAMGYYMVLWLAGLQSVPEELQEAARIDGAGRWQALRYVTMPMLKPTTIFIVMIATIGAFQVFAPQYMLTYGGPFYTTSTMVFYIWQQAFAQYSVGYASAVSILLFVLILIASLIQRRYMGWSEGLFL